MPTPLTLLTSGTLGDVNIGAKLAVAALLPLIAQLDLQLGADFGLGQLKAELLAQLQAALDIQVSITNPAASLVTALNAAVQALAALQAQVAAGLTLPQVALSANFEAIAALQVRLQGIQLMLDLAAGIRLQGLSAIAALEAAFGAGPVLLYGATGQPLAQLLGQISGEDYAAQGIQNLDVCDALFLVSKAPNFRSAAAVLFPMPPA